MRVSKKNEQKKRFKSRFIIGLLIEIINSSIYIGLGLQLFGFHCAFSVILFNRCVRLKSINFFASRLNLESFDA